MSARDDYPPADLLSGSASLYEALWTELDALRAVERRVPYVLWCHDESADENRGARWEYGVYRTQAAAQAECDKLNAPLLTKVNEELHAKYRNAYDRWRRFQSDVMPKPVEEVTDYIAWARRHNRDGSPCRAYPWHDHYYVEPLEFEG